MAQPSQLREGAALLNGIEALRERARTVLDAATWQYLEAGTDDGISTQWAAEAWQQLALHPRILRDADETDIQTEELGTTIALPVMIDPNGGAPHYSAGAPLTPLTGGAAACTATALPRSDIPSPHPSRATPPSNT